MTRDPLPRCGKRANLVATPHQAHVLFAFWYQTTRLSLIPRSKIVEPYYFYDILDGVRRNYNGIRKNNTTYNQPAWEIGVCALTNLGFMTILNYVIPS